jgi:hypothetical protein
VCHHCHGRLQCQGIGIVRHITPTVAAVGARCTWRPTSCPLAQLVGAPRSPTSRTCHTRRPEPLAGMRGGYPRWMVES